MKLKNIKFPDFCNATETKLIIKNKMNNNKISEITQIWWNKQFEILIIEDEISISKQKKKTF